MGDLALQIEGLGKRYLIGATAARDRLFHTSVLKAMSNPFRRFGSLLRGHSTYIDQEQLWALRDISFDVRHGEVVGIIGRNGAGKTTLLKILARITAPTTGCVRIYGSLGALLEVGAAFHIDLTARDNIYLHGSIYGRTKKETDRIFDDIIEFAELERFVDTQVKKFSSGMYSRLAFSVAAHFDTEILIVDEVLATGDVRFVNKCLKRMHEVAMAGRTVLFVSHSVASIAQLCPRAILLDHGRMIDDGPAKEIISRYLTDEPAAGEAPLSAEKTWSAEDAPSFDDGCVRLCAVRAQDAQGQPCRDFDVTESFVIEVDYEVLERRHAIAVRLAFRNSAGNTIFVSMDNLDTPWSRETIPAGFHRARCHVPHDILSEGDLFVGTGIYTNPVTTHFIRMTDSLVLRITDQRDPDGVRGNWVDAWPDSMVRPRLKWEHDQLSSLMAEQVPRE